MSDPGPRSQTMTQEDTMKTDRYARHFAVRGAVRPVSLVVVLAG